MSPAGGGPWRRDGDGGVRSSCLPLPAPLAPFLPFFPPASLLHPHLSPFSPTHVSSLRSLISDFFSSSHPIPISLFFSVFAFGPQPLRAPMPACHGGWSWQSSSAPSHSHFHQSTLSISFPSSCRADSPAGCRIGSAHLSSFHFLPPFFWCDFFVFWSSSFFFFFLSSTSRPLRIHIPIDASICNWSLPRPHSLSHS